MVERFSRLMERTATSASRRQFLGQIGRGAMTAAGVLGGLLAFPTVAAAHRDKPTGKCCSYMCTSVDGSTYGLTRTAPCKNEFVNENGDPCLLIGKSPCVGR
jgi:hypothetical protein